jgi:RNA polymerase sigma factor (sigma-70 family)
VNADTELIARVLAFEDHAAFGELVRRHQSAVRTFLRHLIPGDHALVDDLAQDTFLQAYRGLAHFRGGSAFSTWLLGIAHNQFRNCRRRPQFVSFPAEHDEPSIDSTTSASDLRHDLTLALRQLSNDERLVLHVCYQQSLTVKTHLARGKEKLRQSLALWNPRT